MLLQGSLEVLTSPLAPIRMTRAPITAITSGTLCATVGLNSEGFSESSGLNISEFVFSTPGHLIADFIMIWRGS